MPDAGCLSFVGWVLAAGGAGGGWVVAGGVGTDCGLVGACGLKVGCGLLTGCVPVGPGVLEVV